MVRVCHYLLGPEYLVELLLYADDLEGMGRGPAGRKGLVLAFLFLAALGAPFKWAKQRGGLLTEWVGLRASHSVFQVDDQAGWWDG